MTKRLPPCGAPIALLSLASLGGCTLGPSELLIVLAIIVLLFGASRLPQLGRAVGETLRSFRSATSGEDESEAQRQKALGNKNVAQIHDAKVDAEEPKQHDPNEVKKS